VHFSSNPGSVEVRPVINPSDCEKTRPCVPGLKVQKICFSTRGYLHGKLGVYNDEWNLHLPPPMMLQVNMLAVSKPVKHAKIIKGLYSWYLL
jgi:hypothetical protein